MATKIKKLEAVIPKPLTRTAKFKEIEYPSIYSNIMGIAATPFDVGIIFGEVVAAEGNEVVANPRVKVLLAPEQAENLAKLLNSVLDQFVKNNGQLRAGGNVALAHEEKPTPVN
jgi:hypothetical protein